MNAFSRQTNRSRTSPLPETIQHLPLIIWRNIFVVVDHGSLELNDIEAISHCVRELGQQYPNGIGGLTVIPANGKPPSEAHRLAIKRAYHLVAQHLKAMCWMVEGQGFRAATIRASLAGLRLLLQSPFPTKVAVGLDDGLPWLCAQLNDRSATSATEAVDAVRPELDRVIAALGTS